MRERKRSDGCFGRDLIEIFKDEPECETSFWKRNVGGGSSRRVREVQGSRRVVGRSLESREGGDDPGRVGDGVEPRLLMVERGGGRSGEDGGGCDREVGCRGGGREVGGIGRGGRRMAVVGAVEVGEGRGEFRRARRRSVENERRGEENGGEWTRDGAIEGGLKRLDAKVGR